MSIIKKLKRNERFKFMVGVLAFRIFHILWKLNQWKFSVTLFLYLTTFKVTCKTFCTFLFFIRCRKWFSKFYIFPETVIYLLWSSNNSTLLLLFMFVRPLQRALNQTRLRVSRRLVMIQAVCHSVNISSECLANW